ncbi:MAG: PTS sugar transporter subunit IIA [Thermodesulfobacteriota bacterium]
MIGAVIITHGNVGRALLDSAKAIKGGMEMIKPVSVADYNDVGDLRGRLLGAIREVDGGSGVMVFTDLFGGTPTNIAMSIIEERDIEVMTGVNLPVLIKFDSCRDGRTLTEVASFLKDYGRKSMTIAGDMLRGE